MTRSLPISVLHLSFAAQRGGAAYATWNLHQGLRSIGVDSNMLVSERGKNSSDEFVYGPATALQRLRQRIYKNLEIHLTRPKLAEPSRSFSPARFGSHWEREIRRLSPDLIHLHWINFGHLVPEAFGRWKRPLIWTLHDEWPFTGGCHFTGGCTHFQNNCSPCPMLKRRKRDRMASDLLERKSDAWRNLPMEIVAPSQWMARRAQSSRLFKNHRIHSVPNCVDLKIFREADQSLLRHELGLPTDTPLLLFPAANALSDPRKGFALLNDALEKLPQESLAVGFRLVIVGEEQDRSLNLKCRYVNLGKIQGAANMARVFAAADATLLPSLEDNFPNTALESLACGTPILGLPTGGIPEIIDPLVNGNLASEVSSKAFAEVIRQFLTSPQHWPQMRKMARLSATTRYSPETQAKNIERIYAGMLGR